MFTSRFFVIKKVRCTRYLNPRAVLVMMTNFDNSMVRDDCLSFLPKLDDETVTMAMYDPPYYTSTTRNFDFKKDGKKTRKSYSTYMGDWDVDLWKTEADFYAWIKKLLVETRRVLIPHGSIYMFCRDGYISDIRRLLGEAGYYFKKIIVWIKSNPFQQVMHLNYNTACEFQVFAKKSEKKVVREGEKGIIKTPAVFNWFSQDEIHYPRGKFGDIPPWKVNMHNYIETPICMAPERVVDDKGQVLHTTQKPIEVLLRPILVSSNPGDLVLDATAGMASALEAAKILGRRYTGCEIDEKYHKYGTMRLEGKLPKYKLSRRMEFIVKKLMEKKKNVSIKSYFVK